MQDRSTSRAYYNIGNASIFQVQRVVVLYNQKSPRKYRVSYLLFSVFDANATKNRLNLGEKKKKVIRFLVSRLSECVVLNEE